MTRPLAAVTGLGAVTALGNGAEALWRGTLEGKVPLRGGFGEIPPELRRTVHPRAAAFREGASPALSLSLLAAQEAMDNAGWKSLTENDGLILGTTTGQANYWEPSTIDFLRDGTRVNEFAKRHAGNPLGLLALDLRALFGFTGPSQTIASACCASTQAIAVASHWIASGRVNRCLVGGVELLCELTRTGFQSLQLIAPTECRPFDRDREGINLSEAVVFLCLEAAGPRAYATVNGFGIASDATHMTAPHPEGDGCRRAMLSALKSGGVAPSEIDWIHAHGTGSRQNDLAESKAIRNVFTAAPPVTSSKGIHGHALGASGALETLLVCRALREQIILPTWGLHNQDPAILLEVPRAPESRALRFALKNTLAFGGINASLVIERAR